MIDATVTRGSTTTARVAKIGIIRRGLCRVARGEIGRLMVLGVVHYFINFD